MRPRRLWAVLSLVALVAGACGGGDDEQPAAEVDRTVRIRMVDTAFEPAQVSVGAGEAVRFVFENDGKLPHDAFIGDEEAQADHEEEMRMADADEHGGGHGDEGEAITVDPGDSGELTYMFAENGEVLIGCHQPGHYDAGMRVAVGVEPAS